MKQRHFAVMLLIATMSVMVFPKAISADSLKIANGGFETPAVISGTDNSNVWKTVGSGTEAVIADSAMYGVVPYEGDYSLYINNTNGATTNAYVCYDVTGLEKGVTYKLSLKAYCAKVGSTFILSAYDGTTASSTNERARKRVDFNNIKDNLSKWRQLTVYFSLDNNTSSRIRLYTDIGNGEVFVDDVGLEIASAAPIMSFRDKYGFEIESAEMGDTVYSHVFAPTEKLNTDMLFATAVYDSGFPGASLSDCFMRRGEQLYPPAEPSNPSMLVDFETEIATKDKDDDYLVKSFLLDGNLRPLTDSVALDIYQPDPQRNLIKNSGFETLNSAGWPINWSAYINDEAGISIVNEPERGNVMCFNTAKSLNPWTSQAVAVKEGYEYTVSAWLKTEQSSFPEGKGPRFKAAYDGIAGLDHFTELFPATNGEWVHISSSFRIPKGTTSFSLCPYLYGPGNIYYDDIQLCVSAPPKEMDLLVSDMFYYAEWEYGTATAVLNQKYYNADVLDGKTVEFALLRDDTVVESKVMPAAPMCEFNFDLSLMEMKMPYRVAVMYKNAKGETEDYITRTVYKYPRPRHLDENGFFIGDDGGIVFPVAGWDAKIDDFDRYVEMGVNVVTSSRTFHNATSDDIPALIEFMDAAHEKGLMVMVVMYGGGNAGSPNKLPYTIDCVNSVRNHPALFAWMVQDEPAIVPDETSYDKIYEELITAYETIRELDPDHPVFTCFHRAYNKGARVVDLMGIDPYPSAVKPLTPSTGIISAKNQLNHRKPLLVVLQAWPYGGNPPFEPSPEYMRHMIYQSFFAGADAIGYYNLTSRGETPSIWERALYKGIKGFADMEQEDAFRVFLTKEYPTFNEQIGTDDELWYKSFVKNNELYVIALNRTTKKQTVSIPLISYNGLVSIGPFIAEAADVSGYGDVAGSEKLSFILEGAEVVRYKITPDGTVDFTPLGPIR